MNKKQIIDSLCKLANELDLQDKVELSDLIDAAIIAIASETYTDSSGVTWSMVPVEEITNQFFKNKVLAGTHNVWKDKFGNSSVVSVGKYPETQMNVAKPESAPKEEPVIPPKETVDNRWWFEKVRDATKTNSADDLISGLSIEDIDKLIFILQTMRQEMDKDFGPETEPELEDEYSTETSWSKLEKDHDLK